MIPLRIYHHALYFTYRNPAVDDGVYIRSLRGVAVSELHGVRRKQRRAVSLYGFAVIVFKHAHRRRRPIPQYAFEFLQRASREVDVPYLSGSRRSTDELLRYLLYVLIRDVVAAVVLSREGYGRYAVHHGRYCSRS